MKTFKPLLLCVGASLLLGACSWDTYTKEDGGTGLRPTNRFGQSVYYEDGTYARDQRYNSYRPIRRVLSDEPSQAAEPERVYWR